MNKNIWCTDQTVINIDFRSSEMPPLPNNGIFKSICCMLDVYKMDIGPLHKVQFDFEIGTWCSIRLREWMELWKVQAIFCCTDAIWQKYFVAILLALCALYITCRCSPKVHYTFSWCHVHSINWMKYGNL